MGTFHQDKGDLHGITVVVDTSGDEVFVGRCDTVTSEAVILLDADVHREGDDGRSKSDYLKRAAMVGIWKKFDRLSISLERVASIQPLGEVE